MYGIFIYIWLNFMENVGRYTIHGSYGKGISSSRGPCLGSMLVFRVVINVNGDYTKVFFAAKEKL